MFNLNEKEDLYAELFPVGDDLYLGVTYEVIGRDIAGKEYRFPSETNLLATIPGTKLVVARGTIKIIQGVICSLEELYTDKNYRKQGYASKILKYCIDSGLEYILCLSDNYEALALYNRFGFSIACTDPLGSIYILERKSKYEY